MIELAFAFVAGVISVISPCILPLIPVIFSAGRFSWKDTFLIVFLMIATFTVLGYLTEIISNYYFIRNFAAILLFLFGFVMFYDKFYERYVIFTSKIAGKFSNVTSPIILGLTLGLIWSPCIGPIVGALLSYSVVSGEKGAIIMFFYGIGLASTLSFISFTYSKFSYSKILKYEDKIRKISGALIIIYAIFFLTGIYEKVVFILAKLISL